MDKYALGQMNISCEVRRCGDSEPVYYSAEKAGLKFEVSEADEIRAEEQNPGNRQEGNEQDEIEERRREVLDARSKQSLKIKVTNSGSDDFEGVIHIKLSCRADNPKFFMPGYMYDRNTADMPSSGRKAFPRIRTGADKMPESEFFMTRSDRLAEPVSLVYDNGRVWGISAEPRIADVSEGRFCGFTCSINDKSDENGTAENYGAGSTASGCVSVGYTLGYENAPWLFVQTATVRDREPLTSKNAFSLKAGGVCSFTVTVYDYRGEDERAVYGAIEDTYWRFWESPRRLDGMDETRALKMLSSAIRDYAWLEKEHIYSGFVYDRNDGPAYNRIPSLSWTNGLAVAVPMLLAANRLGDERARAQSLIFINETISTCYNPASGFMYESTVNGIASVRGWWYDGMHSGGHSSYLNGQAVYYLLKAYRDEKEKRKVVHGDWLIFAGKIVRRMNEVMNTDFEYPFAMSERTGAGIEYDSLGSCWFLAASAIYELIKAENAANTNKTEADSRTENNSTAGAADETAGTNGGPRKDTASDEMPERLLKSEEHYYRAFVRKVECYGGPLDTDKAVDSEGILAYIRTVRLLHELTGREYLLDHMRDALYYEFTFKLGYNTAVSIRPLSEIGWSSCGGSITSVANPHIHPMSSAVIGEMKYYLQFCDDSYVRNRLEDTVGWSLQTFNTEDGEYGYGKKGWMSERFCFCEGLLTEKYPDGEPASTWFALMPWASASIIEGLV